MTSDEPKPFTDEEMAVCTADWVATEFDIADVKVGWANTWADRLVAELQRLRDDDREIRQLVTARLPPAEDPQVPHTSGRTWDDVDTPDLIRQLVKQLVNPGSIPISR